jgi:LPXTG-motif cell wall-anchored protein
VPSRTAVHSRALIASITAILIAAAGVAFAAPAFADNPPVTFTSPGGGSVSITLPTVTEVAYGASATYSIAVTCADPFGAGGSPFFALSSPQTLATFSPNPASPSSWDGSTYTGTAAFRMQVSRSDIRLSANGAACFSGDGITGALDTLTTDPTTRPADEAPWVHASLGTAYVGRPFTSYVNGPATDLYTYSGGEDLPAGMTIASNDGISWTPTQSGPVTFHVIATDDTGHQWTTTLSTTVLPAQPWLKATVAPFSTNIPYSDVLEGPDYANYYPDYELTGGALPTGLTLGTNGAITGTPTGQLGDYSYQVTATDQQNNSYSIDVVTELVAGPGPDSPWVTSTIPSAQWGHNFSAQLEGPAGDTYTYVQTGGSLPGGFDVYSDGTISGSSGDTPGNYTVEVTATDPNGTTWVTDVTVTLGDRLPWVRDTIPGAMIGTPYSVRLIAPAYGSSYSYTYQVFDFDDPEDQNPLPPSWLTLGDDGTLSGTPDAISDTMIMVIATDPNGNTFGTEVDLNVTAFAPIWSTTALPALYPGVPITGSVSASGNLLSESAVDYSVVAGDMPSGITLNPDGTITGSPVLVGPYDVTIRAEQDGVYTDQEFTGSVLEPSATITPNFVVGDSDLTLGAAAAGLEPGSTWSLELHSTPTIIGSGVVAGDGTFFSTIRIPAGTPAGAHELILSGTSPSGAAVTAHAWFTLGRNGTILAISFTGPTPGLAALASTGAPDVSGAVLTGLLALIAGAALLLLRRRRHLPIE